MIIYDFQALVTIITYIFGGKGDSNQNNNNSSFETSSSPPCSSSSSGSLNESMSCSRYMHSCGEDEAAELERKFICEKDCNQVHHHSKSPTTHHSTNPNGIAAISVGTDSGILGDIDPSMSTLNRCCDKKFSRNGQSSGRSLGSKMRNNNASGSIKSHEVSPLLKRDTIPSTYGSGNNLNQIQPQLWTVKV